MNLYELSELYELQEFRVVACSVRADTTLV